MFCILKLFLPISWLCTLTHPVSFSSHMWMRVLNVLYPFVEALSERQCIWVGTSHGMPEMLGYVLIILSYSFIHRHAVPLEAEISILLAFFLLNENQKKKNRESQQVMCWVWECWLHLNTMWWWLLSIQVCNEAGKRWGGF